MKYLAAHAPVSLWLSSGLPNNHFTSTLFVGMYFVDLPHTRLCYCDINSSLSVLAEICKLLADVIWEIDDPLAKYIFHGFTNCQSSDLVFACWACQFHSIDRKCFQGNNPFFWWPGDILPSLMKTYLTSFCTFENSQITKYWRNRLPAFIMF